MRMHRLAAIAAVLAGVIITGCSSENSQASSTPFPSIFTTVPTPSPTTRTIHQDAPVCGLRTLVLSVSFDEGRLARWTAELVGSGGRRSYVTGNREMTPTIDVRVIDGGVQVTSNISWRAGIVAWGEVGLGEPDPILPQTIADLAKPLPTKGSWRWEVCSDELPITSPYAQGRGVTVA